MRAEEIHWDKFSPDETPQRDTKEMENHIRQMSSKREGVQLVSGSDMLPCLGEDVQEMRKSFRTILSAGCLLDMCGGLDPRGKV